MHPRNARRRPLETVHQIILGLALATLFVLVLEAAQGDVQIDIGHGELTRVSIGDDGSLRLRLHNDSESLSVKSRGPLMLGADERSVAELEAGGWLEVEHHDVDGRRHELKVRAAAGGRPEHEYRLDGEATEFDATARSWFQGVALVLYRRVGIDAEARADRLWQQGGLDRLLGEVEQIPSDYTSATYLEAALEDGGLRGEDLVAWLRAIRGIESDSRASALLSKIETESLASPGALEALASVAREVESDHYLARLLEHHLSRLPGLPSAESENLASGLLSMAENLESDHHLASLLEAHARAIADAAQVAAAEARVRAGDGATAAGRVASLGGFEAVERLLRRLESDHHRARALGILARAASPEQVPALARAGGAIESDHHLAAMLTRLVESHPEEARRPGSPLRDAIDRALQRMESEYHREQVTEVLEAYR
ncbi:MAG: hypothetical protein MI919_28015 [Holophagales bacterium]|nr:hypothetical protein [Holophagales bacterium]